MTVPKVDVETERMLALGKAAKGTVTRLESFNNRYTWSINAVFLTDTK